MAAVTLGVSAATTSNASSYTSGSFTPAVGDLLVVIVVASGTTLASPTVTNTGAGGALGWTLVATAQKNAGADRIYVFVANTLVSSAVATTFTFNCTGDAATGVGYAALRVSGMTRTGSGAVRQAAQQDNQSGGVAPAPAYASAALTGNPHIGVVGNGANPAIITPPASWTERSDTGHSSPTSGIETASRDSGFTGTTVTWGSTSATAFGSAIIELDASVPPVVGTGTSNGTSTAAGAGTVQRQGTGTSAGTSTAAAAGTRQARGTGTASGTSTAAGAGDVLLPVVEGAGTSSGTSTASGAGTRQARGTGTSSGTSAASGAGAVQRSGTGTSSGTSTASAVGSIVLSGSGSVFPSGDSFFSSVDLLLRFDGSHGATSTTDESPSPKTMTFAGQAALSTAQKKYGTASLDVDGSGNDGVTTPDTASLNLGANDFTIETWVRFRSVPGSGNYPSIAGQRNSANVDHAWTWEFNSDTDELEFVFTTDGTLATLVRVVGAWSPSPDTWYHVAISRNGSSIRQFVDGTQVGTTHTSSATIHNSSEALAIGNVLESGVLGTAIVALNGFLDDFRLTVGVGRYTGNFTPTQIPTTIEGATGNGTVIRLGSGTAAGTSTATAFASVTRGASGTSSGASTAAGAGVAVRGASGTSSGASTAAGAGVALRGASGTSSGTSSASGAGTIAGAGSTGAAAGTSSASGAGRAVRLASGTSSGASTAAGAGVALRGASGTSSGTSSASGAGVALRGASGASSGASTATGTGQAARAGSGTSSGTSAASASGSIVRRGSGAATGTSSAAGDAIVTTPTVVLGSGSALGTSGASGVASSGAPVFYPIQVMLADYAAALAVSPTAVSVQAGDSEASVDASPSDATVTTSDTTVEVAVRA